MILKVDLADKINEIQKPWLRLEVLQINDQVVRLALFQGEYHWHKHSDQDELFYVVKGEISIQLKDQPPLILGEGQVAVIPRGVRHCPKSLESSYVLMFEPHILKSSGD